MASGYSEIILQIRGEGDAAGKVQATTRALNGMGDAAGNAGAEAGAAAAEMDALAHSAEDAGHAGEAAHGAHGKAASKLGAALDAASYKTFKLTKGLSKFAGEGGDELKLLGKYGKAVNVLVHALPAEYAVAAIAVTAVAAGVWKLLTYQREAKEHAEGMARAVGAKGLKDDLEISAEAAQKLAYSLADLREKGVGVSGAELRNVAETARRAGGDSEAVAKSTQAYIDAIGAGGEKARKAYREVGGLAVASLSQDVARLGISREVVEELHKEDVARASIAGVTKEQGQIEEQIAQMQQDYVRTLERLRVGKHQLNAAGARELDLLREGMEEQRAKLAAIDEEFQTRAASAEAMARIHKDEADAARTSSEAAATEAAQLAVISLAEATGEAARNRKAARAAQAQASRDREAISAARVVSIDGQIETTQRRINDLLAEQARYLSRSPEDEAKLADEITKAKNALLGLSASQAKAGEEVEREKKRRKDAAKAAAQEGRAAADARTASVLAEQKSASEIEKLRAHTAAETLRITLAEIAAEEEAAKKRVHGRGIKAEAERAAATNKATAERIKAQRDAAKAEVDATAELVASAVAVEGKRVQIRRDGMAREIADLRERGQFEQADALERKAGDAAQLQEVLAAGAKLDAARAAARASGQKDVDVRKAQVAQNEYTVAQEQRVAAAQLLALEQEVAARRRFAESVSASIARAGELAGGKAGAMLGAASKAAITLGKHWKDLKAGAGDVISSIGAVAAAGIDGTTGQAAVLAGFETAAGLAALAMGDPKAAMHFASAGLFAAVAGLSAAGIIGSAGGGSAATGGGGSAATGGAGGAPAGPQIVNVNFARGFVVGGAQEVGRHVQRAVKSLKATGYAQAGAGV